MSADKKMIGVRLRRAREEPLSPSGRPRYSREKWAIRLRLAAGPHAAELPDVKNLAQMIKQWERGDHIPGPTYRPLYVKVTGKIEAELFGAELTAQRSVWRAGGLNRDLSGDDEERLIRAARRPVRADLSVVESLGTILAAQRRTEDTIGTWPLIEPVRAQLAAIEGMVTEARGHVRRPLLEVASQWAQFAGWLHTSGGHQAPALAYLGRTLEWATEIGDQELIGVVMSWQGYVAEKRGQVGPMIGVSQAAQRLRRSVGRVYDIYQEARGRAILGEAEEVDRLTDIAAQDAARIRPGASRPWEYYYFAPGFFTLEHGLTYRILGRSDPARNADAVESLSAGLRDLPRHMRGSEWAGDFVYQLGLAYQQAGEHEQAARVAEDLATLARPIASERLARLASELG